MENSTRRLVVLKKENILNFYFIQCFDLFASLLIQYPFYEGIGATF